MKLLDFALYDDNMITLFYLASKNIKVTCHGRFHSIFKAKCLQCILVLVLIKIFVPEINWDSNTYIYEEYEKKDKKILETFATFAWKVEDSTECYVNY